MIKDHIRTQRMYWSFADGKVVAGASALATSRWRRMVLVNNKIEGFYRETYSQVRSANTALRMEYTMVAEQQQEKAKP